MAYDRSLIVADPRRCEPKKFGGWKGNFGKHIVEHLDRHVHVLEQIRVHTFQ